MRLALCGASEICYFERVNDWFADPSFTLTKLLTEISKMADLTPIEIARFWSRVTHSTDFQCWDWQGRKNDSGYGRYKSKMAHRVAYESVNGPIPDGMIIRHTCDNPSCCNPRHLIAGTHQQNSDDCVERGRQAKGTRNGRARLTDAQVREIRSTQSETLASLADRFGVSRATISYVRSGRSYKYVA